MIKSKWAYNNGTRIMKQALESKKSELYEFINGKYAECGYKNKLWVKTYSNKKQCEAKIEKLKESNINCSMSTTFPFTINLIDEN